MYNFVREYMTSDEIDGIWNPKKDESVIHDKHSYSMDDNTRFIILIPCLSIAESTDFGYLYYLLQLEDGTIYRQFGSNLYYYETYMRSIINHL